MIRFHKDARLGKHVRHNVDRWQVPKFPLVNDDYPQRFRFASDRQNLLEHRFHWQCGTSLYHLDLVHRLRFAPFVWQPHH